jgi:hypothetical protein
MSDAKWRTALDVIQHALGPNLRFRCKCLGEPEGNASHWLTSFPYHVPRPFKAIEWLEIDPIVRSAALGSEDRSSNLRQGLEALAIPFIEREGFFMILGYVIQPENAASKDPA